MEAKELFSLCRQLAEEHPSAFATRRMHELLVLTCAEGCRREGGTFGGLFAQVDFLCKLHSIEDEERREVQTMRRHSNSREAVDSSEWLFDLRALSLLVAAVFGESMPGELRHLLPSHPRLHEKGLNINQRYVRCIVTSWNENTIQASTDDRDILIDYANKEQGRDFDYLRKLLREGMQLNLLDCHVEKGELMVVTPGIIVVEPDFLVDISSVAACFTNYGHHPLLYTVNRLKPKANTQAVLLGNFAGTALDYLIHHSGETLADGGVQATLHRSFREQALRFCACVDFDAEKFKRDAIQQVQHISETVGILFDREEEREKALLEPSFVCERLGLQGRVDLMTIGSPTPLSHEDRNTMLLVEQKSGKNPKIEHQSHDTHGLQLESHYVQLLLYYGILRYNFGYTEKHVDIRLLYSRYPAAQGLMTVSYYQQLFREAIRLRNQIVATELLIAREGFGRIMPFLSSSIIYKEVKKDRIFHEYIEPELNLLSQQIRNLSPLEHAYYERMMTFVYREQACQKLGGSEARLHHSGGAGSDLWLMPVTEKIETGNIFLDLTIDKLKKTSEYSGYDLVQLKLSGHLSGQENFRRGDMVFLYAYSEQPDVRENILYKGTMEDIGVEIITIQLTNGQQSAELLMTKNLKWAVEHASADSGTSANIRGLQQFITANTHRKALLLGQRSPEADLSVSLSRSYHPNYDEIILRALQTRDYFLLVGPPGTGKTSMALRYLVTEELSPAALSSHMTIPPKSILLMSYTNRAVDEICAMLTETGLDYLRIGSEASCDPRFRDHLLEAMLEHISKLDAIKKKIVETPIIVGTTSTMQARQEIFSLKHFSLCIIDEASQILEPSVIGLLASEQIERFILIGDHKQLPAVVQQSEMDSYISNPQLRALCIDNCRQSLFERLLRWEQHQGRTQFIETLRYQGRMHPEVAQFPATAFYTKERLLAVPLPHQQERVLAYQLPAEDRIDEVLKEKRVVFFDSGVHGAYEASGTTGSDKVNICEARMVADLLRRIHRFYGKRFSAQKTVGVIVPYRNQIAMIRQEISQLGIAELLDVSIDTVERYQGSQRDVIIYSFTISHTYQLDFLAANTFMESGGHIIDRKLNVALTRARCQMLMIGNASVLSQNDLFRKLIEQYSVTFH
jgi:hypothetical protein